MTAKQQDEFSMILASSVHDMKNSLGMLLNSLEEVVNSTPAEDQEQSQRFGVLQYEASRINSELIQLLSIYRMQNQLLPTRVDEIYVEETLEEQVARNDMLFRMRNLELQVDCDEDLAWYYDGELVGGVIHNILVNCARYGQKTLRLAAEEKDGYLVLSVEDDGTGYPDFMLTDIGEQFKPGSEFSEGSTHLGLFFAQKVAELHTCNDRRGYIKIANGGSLGGGLFQLWLP